MIRLLVSCIFVLVAGALCVLAMSAKPSPESACKNDEFTVFLTGNELGVLKPCGCFGGQLGGLDRRSAVINNIPASRRMVVGTGSLVETDSEQDLIKFSIIIKAFDLLGYDLLSLTKKDVEMAQNLGLLDSINSVFSVIASDISDDVNLPTKFTKQGHLNDRILTVTVATLGSESASIKRIKELFPAQSDALTANILILNRYDPDVVSSIVNEGVVDCLVCPAESDEAQVLDDKNGKTLVVSVGRLGKYIGQLQISNGQAENTLKFEFSAVPVEENLPREKSLVELYKVYQQLVKEAKLLEKWPRAALPDGLKYTGSKSCMLCHDYEYEKWSSKAHAGAYATLEKVGSMFDPECVICHVVGMEYESGFVSEDKTDKDLKNVGCENCHGPGSEHIRTLGKTKTADPRSDCIDCHTPEHSGEYEQNEQFYFEKIIHWREPNVADDVKY